MAQTIGTTVYAGDEAAGFISASLLSGETLGKENVTILPNVSFKINLKALDFAAGSVKDATCAFDDGSAVTYDEKSITPERFQLHKELCKKEWFSTYAGAQMRAGVDGTIPGNFAEYLISHAGAVVGADVETSIWQGDTATNGQFSGFVTQMIADVDVVDVPTPAALTASNIVTKLGELRDTIPNSVYGKEDLNIYLGTAAFKFYIAKQAALGYMDQYHAGVTAPNFEGIPLVWCPGMAANKMVAARKSNLFFATDLLSDLTEVKVIDMTTTDGSDNVRLVMKYNAGVGYAVSEDIALYSA